MKLSSTSSPRVDDEVCQAYGTLFSCVKTGIQAMANVSRFLWNRRMKHLRHWVQSFGWMFFKNCKLGKRRHVLYLFHNEVRHAYDTSRNILNESNVNVRLALGAGGPAPDCLGQIWIF